MSDETPVEWRLRELGDRLREHGGNDVLCGREAIRLLRNIANDHGDSDLVYALGDSYADSINALLARCTEGPR